MIKLLPPNVTDYEKKIRAIGAASLPTSNAFWFEDIPQIPAKLQFLPFQLSTDHVGKPHKILIDGVLQKSFIPDKANVNLNLVLNAGIYDIVIQVEDDTFEGTFQVSLKELFWWAWIQHLIPTFQTLDMIEVRFNSPLHIMTYETTLSPELTSIQSTQFAIRNFARSSYTQTIEYSTLLFAGGLFNSPVMGLSVKPALKDRRADYSQLLLPFIYKCVSRRTAFLSTLDPKRIKSCSWNSAEVLGKEVERKPIAASPQVTLELWVEDRNGDVILNEDLINLIPKVLSSNLRGINISFNTYRVGSKIVFRSEEILSSRLRKSLISLSVMTQTYEPNTIILPINATAGNYSFTIPIIKNTRRVQVNASENTGWVLSASNTPGNFTNAVVLLRAQDHKNKISVEQSILNGYEFFRLSGYNRTLTNVEGNEVISYVYSESFLNLDSNSAVGLYPMSI